jgi:hypothetical protein
MSGCGGSSDGGSPVTPPPTTNNPTITIDWPTQTRGITAPISAVSMKATLSGANPDGSDATIIATREGDAAYSKAYAMPIVRTGTRALTVRFFADTFATAETANVTLNVVVGEDGTIRRSNGQPLEGITTATRIARVVVDSDQLLPVGVDTRLTAYAETPDGKVNVTGGGIQWQLLEGTGPDRLALTVGGTARGARIGWQEVRATIDGVQSAPQLVKVGFQRSGIVNERSDIFAACDAPGDRLWAVGTDGNLYQLTKSSLFRNEAIVQVGVARDIARSADNHYVYVPTVEGVKRYNTLTATLDKIFMIDGNVLENDPYAVAVDPTAPLRNAVSFQTNDGDYVTALFMDGVRQFSALTTDSPVRGLAFSDNGRYLFALTASGTLIRLEIVGNGLSESGNRINNVTFREAAPWLQSINGQLFTHNLNVFDVTSFTSSGGPEKFGVGYGILGERGITPRIYSAQVENAGRANAIILYQNNGTGYLPLTGLDIPVDRLVAELVAADANGFVYMTSGATLVRVSVF